MLEQLWGEDLDRLKGKILRRLYKETEKRIKAKKRKRNK